MVGVDADDRGTKRELCDAEFISIQLRSLPTFLSSGLIWDISMAMLSVFHTQEWLVKYSRTIMALWRRVIVFIILR